MNIHGYKKKLKSIKYLLAKEIAKGDKGHPAKVSRLTRSKLDCAGRIRALKLKVTKK